MSRRFIAILTALAIGICASAQDQNWSQWRGPEGTGVARDGDPPATWSEQKNIKWKVKIPGRGSSTPIIWGDSIFIQTAIPSGQQGDREAAPPAPPPPGDRPRSGREGGGGRRGGGFGGMPKPTEPFKFVLLCIDRKTGQTKWEQVCREEVPHEGHHRDHGFASYSPVTDGEHVWAHFGSRGLHCFDMNGNRKWEKDLGKMRTRLGFGEGSSPALYRDVIVITWDHQGDDFIAAFDKKTGEEKWRQTRDEDQTWATPLVVEHDGKAQVIASSSRKVRSYDLETGKQIWEAPGLTDNPIPTPVSADGVVYTTAGFRGSALYAIRLGSSGDLTGTDAIIWTANRGTPYVPSPLLYGDRLYVFQQNNGVLSCFDTKTGKPIVSTRRIDDLEGVYASPVGAANRVYLIGRNGTTVVIKHLDQGSELQELAVNELDDRIDASPAIVGKELFLRGHQYLYCIAE